jgi:hypothetical protein
MNDFIESFATQQLLPPWVAKGGRTWAFVVRTDPAKARGYLDTYFNGAYPDRAPFYYEPLPGPQLGLMVAAWRPDVSSQYPGRPAGWDTVSYWEIYWTFPVYRYRITGDNLLLDRQTVWVQPFSFGDNASAVFSSREIWGTDMTMATVDVDDGLPPEHLHLDVIIEGIKRFHPRSHSEPLAFIHFKTNQVMAAKDTNDAIGSLLRQHPDLADLVMLLRGSGVFAGQEPGSASPSVELNNLKQFRDCADMGTAIYRAIVASRTSHTAIDNIVTYDGADVELDFMWSDSVAEILEALFVTKDRTRDGPPSDHKDRPRRAHGADWDMRRLKMPVEFGFSYTSDVTFEVIETLHTYGG